MSNKESQNYNLLAHLADLPTQSGIYQFFDDEDNLLYVGKAKNLKNRIKSYFSIESGHIAPKNNLSPRIALMVSQIARIHTFLTNNEQDALILENSLIKSLKPRYNILLRDDKTYPYIYIDKSLPYPRFELTRQVLKSNQIQYFGPFVSGARELLDSLYDNLPLVQKKSCVKGKKACIFHQIRKCPAPCENKISTQTYAHTIAQGIALIEDKKTLLTILESKMHSLSANLQFEEAAIMRDRIQKITQMKNQSIIDMRSGDYDVFVLQKQDCLRNSQDSHNAHKKSHTPPHTHILMMLFIRNGRIISSDFILLHEDIQSHNLPQLYTQALLNHYKTQMPLVPQEILIPPFDFPDLPHLQQLLREQTRSFLKIVQPQRGTKKDLLQLAHKNALEIGRLHTQQNDTLSTLVGIKELCGLREIPYSIEVFDTSHHSGTHNVGGMIVYENSDFIRSKYRRYQLSASDEYNQMHEMLMRRAQSFDSNPPPALWLLDGGRAQINLALDILKSAGANVEVLAIAKMKHNAKAYRAKGNAFDILRSKNAEFKLKPNDKRLQFFQKLRDEVHRYAITYHRYKKQKDIQRAQMMGKHYTQAQIKKLLDYFGSFESLKSASQEQINSVLSRKNRVNA
ncbi:excinuclease ABC subunit UvrC [Helicobacter sp. MIT 21-1697]|uniref:excinuclease ABC subunit UvrC n=1 Tax=Helicobacter sp. MIT 21-1697 TaxID=2993733 RepID=UPI00224B941E|nr:excinuclease ABC subunit UvrC [Helicobacter sp. MIT 21-1697]MCX2716557.1 excinuclease ABC subunit UvrC [Helicobacter sp. MIT 21-1697]